MKITRLKELRKESRLTQNQVAEYLKISPPAYSHYETGFTEPDVANLIKLSELYKVSIDYIVGISDERHLSFFSAVLKKINIKDQDMLIAFAKRLVEVNERRTKI